MKPNLDLPVHQQEVPAAATKEAQDVADMVVVVLVELWEAVEVAAVKSTSPTFVISSPLCCATDGHHVD